MAYSNSPKFRRLNAVQWPSWERGIGDPQSRAIKHGSLTTDGTAKRIRLASIRAAVLRLRLKGEGRL